MQVSGEGDFMKVTMPEKRNATCYGYVKEKNKKWLVAQAKKHDMKLSPTLDFFLDKMRTQYPVTPKKKAA